MGYRPEGFNPCRGIRRCRRTKRERFLSEEAIGRLAERLVEDGVGPFDFAERRMNDGKRFVRNNPR